MTPEEIEAAVGVQAVPSWADDEPCERCGGDGFVELSESPELWDEDCFVEEDRLVQCPDCRRRARHPKVPSDG